MCFSFSFSISEELQVGRGAPAIWRRSGHSYNGAAAWSFCSLGSWQSWVLPGLPISWFFLFLFLLHNIMTLYCHKLPRFWNSRAFAYSVHWFVIWRSVTLSLHMRSTVLAKMWRLVGCSKSVWHAIGKSWPFGQENLFSPKKHLKTTISRRKISASPHFGKIWRPNCWRQVNH